MTFVEEFFNAHQKLGWKKAGTLNLNIRYGQMTMALIAQAAIHSFKALMATFVFGRIPSSSHITMRPIRSSCASIMRGFRRS
jgi:hypothetical protein